MKFSGHTYFNLLAILMAPILISGCAMQNKKNCDLVEGQECFPIKRAAFVANEDRYHECFSKLMMKDENAHKSPEFVNKLRQCVGAPMSQAIACKINAQAEFAKPDGNEAAVDKAFHQCLKTKKDPISKCFLEGAEVLERSSSHTRGDRATRYCLEEVWDEN